MPELPEVEVLRRSLEPHLVGERISKVEVLSPALREPLDAEALQTLTGMRIQGLRRRSKYLLIDLDGGLDGGVDGGFGTASDGVTFVVHLGMSGRLTIAAGDVLPERHEHLRLGLASGRLLRFRDPRRFGLAFVVPTGGLADDRHFAHLGIEPLSEAFTGPYLRSAARGRRAPVKTFLMDASVVVGLGNIYVAEALHRAGIHPKRSVARISEARWAKLVEHVVAVLRDALVEGGTTLNDFRDGDDESGYFQVSLAVYGREGQPCVTCRQPIRRIVQSNRSTFYCSVCQR